jgi:hypothetical protein
MQEDLPRKMAEMIIRKYQEAAVWMRSETP